ncbi:hypothetical protein EZV62_001098 [Acer yangbiense]|uniref:Uncharacterized protein n=1 Tax=Acer yangbiense TaxID=1000413 RepID=A0A5C7ITS3_9ROSI|nr:hypothetical protein EZV62_001098 [Acer yangbiense]
MEEHKLRYLQQLLRRRNESSVNKYVMALRGFEEIKSSKRKRGKFKLLGLIHNFIPAPFAAETGVTRDAVGKEENFGFMHSAMDLKEAGVTFKKADGSNLFDIKFENGFDLLS